MTDDPFAYLIPPLRKLMELREARDKAKVAAEQAENAFRAQENLIHDQLKSAGRQPHVTLDLGEPYGEVRFQRRVTPYGRVYDHEAAVEALKEIGRFEELTMPATHVKFRQKALNDFVKEVAEHGGKLPPGIEPAPREFVSITRKKKGT